ncbi:Hypothetical protein, putative [Bodo saltans]|uniref:Uncharacterized protein n=1 Tax=Bodo saltans TaxID=75058 RepID=A0A0S4IQL5_BODSA|nr:Hypothetical protein, putative [Bodo saltans]|eukprot:CUF28990.1 Hypothetical protein, putative [Bodo saltans]
MPFHRGSTSIQLRFYCEGFEISATLRCHNVFDPSTWPKSWKARDIKRLIDEHLKPNASPNYKSLEAMLVEDNLDALERELQTYVELPKYYNPYTWPRDWKALDIKTLIQEHLKPNKSPDYKLLETMFSERNLPSVAATIRDCVEAPPPTPIDANSTPIRYYDHPQTWPRNWNTTDMENLLSDNLMNPDKVPNYALLATQLAKGHFEALEDELWYLIELPVVEFFDLYNWPRWWKAADIEKRVRPYLKPRASPDYKLLQELLEKDEIEVLARKLQDDVDIKEDNTSNNNRNAHEEGKKTTVTSPLTSFFSKIWRK